MKLKGIDIQQYKSIQNAIRIPLNDEEKFYTFIGKNGSGKTNVLRAIEYVLRERSRTNQEKCTAKCHLELTDAEYKKYAPIIDVDRTVQVSFSGSEPQVRRVYAPIITIALQTYKTQLQDTLEELKMYWNAYEKTLLSLERDEWKQYLDELVVYEETDGEQNRLTRAQRWKMQNLQENMQRMLQDIERFIEKNFQQDMFCIGYYYLEDTLIFSSYYDARSVRFYRLDENIDYSLHPVFCKALGLTKEDVKKANKKIKAKIKRMNKKLETQYVSLQATCEKFQRIYEEVIALIRKKEDLYYREESELEEKQKSLMDVLKKHCFRKTYYLDNERTLLFAERIAQGWDGDEYFNAQNTIERAMAVFLLERGYCKTEEEFSKRDKVKEECLQEWVNVLNEEFLNGLVPKFDKGEIDGFELRLENKSLALYVREKNGSRVLFNNTSLGRRWYLTYHFVKQLLKAGDCLLIDEPGAFLHPQAQEEIRDDLIELSKKGIYVFIATHSEYMLPENLHNIYNVTMDEDGTHVRAFDKGDELCEEIKSSLGIKAISNILFYLSKTLLLVEGTTDKVCVEKFADLLGYDLDEYKIMPCNGSPIFDVTYLCIQYNIKFKSLLDLDNKSKPEGWMERKYGYKEYLDKITHNENCVFTPDIRQKKSLEDCFHEEDQREYFFDYTNRLGDTIRKIDAEKIKKANTFHEETLRNFEQLFIKLGIPKLDNTRGK